MSVENYKSLIVWQRAMEVALLAYELTEQFPKQELFGLTSQIRRAAVSIPSNIAEGKCRSGPKEFAHFLKIAFASGAELETQIMIVKKLHFGKNLSCSKIEVALGETMRMLNTLINKQPSA